MTRASLCVVYYILKEAADDEHKAEDDQRYADDGTDDGQGQYHTDDHQYQPQYGTNQAACCFDNPYDQAPEEPEGIQQPVNTVLFLCHFYLHLSIRCL